jgi:hypothetical protein
MLTLINWLLVAALLAWVAHKPKYFFDTLGHMLAASMVLSAALWWVTGYDKVSIWSLSVRVVPAAVMMAVLFLSYGVKR